MKHRQQQQDVLGQTVPASTGTRYPLPENGVGKTVEQPHRPIGANHPTGKEDNTAKTVYLYTMADAGSKKLARGMCDLIDAMAQGP